jgi:hypothetical protein
MSSSLNPDLIKVTEVFLIPSSFLVAALGTADTNLHRAAVSFIGLVVSVLWWVCSSEALQEQISNEASPKPTALSRRIRIMAGLPAFFVFCWIMSVVCHVLVWNQPLGT